MSNSGTRPDSECADRTRSVRATDVKPIPQAASVLVLRGTQRAEVFVVRRAEHLRFFGGFLAFPGGKIHAGDAQIAVQSASTASSPFAPREEPGVMADFGPALRVAAVRELFEETGVLLARQPGGSFPVSCAALDQSRREILDGTQSWEHFLRSWQLTIRDNDLEPVGRLVTPEFSSIRFDTAFYVAHVPQDQAPAVWRGELQEGCFTFAHDVLSRWERGELLISPPTVAILQCLRHNSWTEGKLRLRALLQSLETGKIHPIFFAPRVQLIPLRTQALPPSTHTNAYLLGTGPLYLIDPGPADPEEQERLFDVLDEYQAHGPALSAVVLTHHHADHIGAARACAERYAVPIWAHARTADLSRDKVRIDRALREGDRLDLGKTPDSSGPWRLEVLHTPGHASDHLAFYDPHLQLLLAGDMVSTLSSVVIAPPDGDLATYMASLSRLRELPIRMLLPGHGSPTSRGRQVLDEAIAHRRKREAMLLEILARGSRTVAELVLEMYRGVPDPLMRFALWQVVAALEKLHREGKASVAGQGADAAWTLAGAERLQT